MPLAGIDTESAAPKCYHTSHHKTMKWDTKAGGQEEGLTMMSTLLCIRGGIITIKSSGQLTGKIYVDGLQYGVEFSYIDKDGNIVTVVWTISEEDFLDSTSLTLDEIKVICNEDNPELVNKGYAEGVYNYCVASGLNPKILSATLGQEQRWCLNGNYEKAFGVGPSGFPTFKRNKP